MSKVRVGLIQMSLKCGTDLPRDEIREVMIEAHVPLIEEAGKRDVQVLCLQELFTQPYFPPSQDIKWCDAAEAVPDGPTVERMRALAKRHEMAIIVPVVEEDLTGIYYNTAAVIDADGTYLGKYRKTHLPQVAGFYEKFFFKPGNTGYPVFETAFLNLGVYICYDRHFPEGWRALALNGAEYIVNPSATTAGLSQSIWALEQPAAAVANGVYIGAINRVGTEAPWNIGKFYGSTYVVDPHGKILAQAGEDEDELVVADIDLSMVREARNRWQFFRDRRPETYGGLAEPR